MATTRTTIDSAAVGAVWALKRAMRETTTRGAVAYCAGTITSGGWMVVSQQLSTARRELARGQFAASWAAVATAQQVVASAAVQA